MTIIEKKTPVTKYERRKFEIAYVIHDLPTWMFPHFFNGDNRMLCPVCHGEMNMQIGRGVYIGKCSYIRLDNGDVHPIHRECYDKLQTI